MHEKNDFCYCQTKVTQTELVTIVWQAPAVQKKTSGRGFPEDLLEQRLVLLYFISNFNPINGQIM